MKIIQMLPTIAYGDAVGNDCAAIYKILKDDGWDTAIYAENIDYRLPKGFAHRVSDMPSLSANDILIYHLSTGTELNKRLKDYPCRKVIFYHNILCAYIPAFWYVKGARRSITRDGLRLFSQSCAELFTC